MTRENPVGVDYRNAELQGFLVLHTRSTNETARGRRRAGSRSRSCTDEMGSVDLDLVTPFRAHFTQGKFRVFENDGVLDVSETNRDTGCISHGMSADVEYVGLESACGGTHDEMEAVFSVDSKTGELS